METVAEDFVVDLEAYAFVEDVEFAFPVIFREFLDVLVDASVELRDIFESFFLEECCAGFAADSTGAVGDDFFIFVLDELFFYNFREFFPVLHVENNGIFEFSNVGFVLIAHVDDNEIFVFVVHLLEVFGLDVFASVGVGVEWLFVLHSNQLWTGSNEHFFESFVGSAACFELHVGKTWVLAHSFNVGVAGFVRSTNGSIDTEF